ncbi:response regulator receiver (plasmid) [Gemmatirosa kalamazoonensis]|uniref:Response regulator receiver n=1 Tax=Gemmatirosa kalamazoonensis TaxID=861299 RepID=W0RQT8_9BACT|nr:response regulator [Gemmatirosa kalamazoonensis]AHG93349.1 response regulator receiver [Gemmatirosa kalamazoonensis]
MCPFDLGDGPAAEPAARAPSAVPPVLLVDDVPADAAASRAVLERGGYEVAAEVDGDVVLRLVRAALTRCVVSELHIGCAEGPCVVMVLKGDRRRLPRLRVLVYTRHRSAADLDRALQTGSDAVLYKPATASVLLREVRRLDALGGTNGGSEDGRAGGAAP